MPTKGAKRAIETQNRLFFPSDTQLGKQSRQGHGEAEGKLNKSGGHGGVCGRQDTENEETKSGWWVGGGWWVGSRRCYEVIRIGSGRLFEYYLVFCVTPQCIGPRHWSP